jgi:hypothetical protein
MCHADELNVELTKGWNVGTLDSVALLEHYVWSASFPQ